MFALRSKIAAFMLVWGMLFTSAQFAGVASTSSYLKGGSCHEDPSPSPAEQAPQNHDCCVAGHLHAATAALASLVPNWAAMGPTVFPGHDAAKFHLTPTSQKTIGPSPPAIAVPLRI
ncbi:MAG TPA: hypothetical protein VG498_00150 [Terriglobales bacterium]|nr:hypothetical protein [Terriglobales bacterium]